METTRWIVAALLMLLFLWVGVGQWWAMYAIPRTKNSQGQSRNYSLVPFLGGISGTVALLVAPSETLHDWWWVPLLIDPGCALLVGSLFVLGIGSLTRNLFSR